MIAETETTSEPEDIENNPRRRQQAALAVISMPVVHQMGLRPGRETRRRLKDAEAFAALDGVESVVEWARWNYRTRGVRST